MVGTVPIASLHDRIFDYASRVHDLRTPSDVLDQLHDITTKSLPLPVLGAARFPSKAAGWDSVQLGNSIFLHKGVPKGWWEEYQTLARGKFAPTCSWRSPAWLPIRGLRRNRWWNRPGLIGGQTSCSSNMEFATDCLVPSPAGGS
jgi:hypothetical protein